LQAGLQSLAKPWYRRRALRVFRDETSLSASPELWPAIEGALSEAKYFVLVASPEAAASRWVDQEVRWWREHRSHETVLIALTDGELRWDDGRGDFDVAAPIPPGLRRWFPREPLWVDLRWARGEQDVSMRNPRFRDSVGELAAPLHGLPKDELIGEDISQHRRTLRLARGAVALLVLLLAVAVVGGVVALVQRNNARNQSELAVAGQVAATSVANLADRLDVAQLLAAEGHSRRETPQTTAALFQAATASPHLAKVVDTGSRIAALTPATNADRVYVGDVDGTVRAWPVSNDRAGPPIVELGGPVRVLQSSENGRYLAAGDEAGNIAVVDLRDRSASRVSVKGPVEALAVSDDGRWLAVGSDAFQVALHDLHAGQVEAALTVDSVVGALAFRDYGLTLMVGGRDGSVQRRFLPTLEPLGEPTHPRTPAGNYTAAYSANGRYFGFYKFGVWAWPTDTMRRKLVFPITSTGGATAVAIASDASRAAVATEGRISVVEPRLAGSGPYNSGAQPGGLVTEPMTGISGRTGFLAFLGPGDRLVSSSGSLLALWDLNQHTGIARPLPVRLPDTSTASFPPGLGIARGGFLIAWSSEQPEVGIWDPEAGRRAIAGSNGTFVAFGAVALSEGGRYLASYGTEGLQIWRVAEPDSPATVPSTAGYASELAALQPERANSLLAIWSNGRIDRVSLEAAQRERIARPPTNGTSMNDVAVAPRSGIAIEVIDGRLYQVDLTTGRTSAGPKLGLPFISAVALSRDGRLLVATDGDESAVLWDMRGGRTLRRMAVGRVSSVALDPQARLMGALTAEGIMSVWDVGNGTKLGEVQLPAQGETVSPDHGLETTMRFSSDGDLWTATAGGGLIRWPMSPEAWTRSICRTVNRSLTEDEWDRYIGATGAPEFSCPGS
jgi:WD40 repeat protein